MPRQPTPVDRFFEGIAARAAEAAAAPVFDAPQEATSIAWAALAVHPLSVLETEYVGLVREAERNGGNDPDRARENGFRAMTQFFSLNSGTPTLLGPDREPLIEERLKDLAARSEFVGSMIEDRPEDALQELAEVVADAADIIATLTTAEDLPFASAGVQTAAAYIGMFARSADQAAQQWAHDHDAVDQVEAYLDEVNTQLVDPLCTSSNAVASARSLYNIAPFYLFRLMHRFVGGDQAEAMDLAAKGVASGEATKSMHPRDWQWLTGWHEAKVVELKEKLADLDQRLRDELGVPDQMIRFFLKGGRAMYTALGQPQLGENDWDTGILIDPSLAPDQWYRAFAEVNDLVVSFLDQARFSYSTLLARHANELGAVRLAARAAPTAPAEPPRYFSRLATLAEHDAERHDRRQRAARSLRAAAVGGRGRAPVALVARPRVQPVGVNGELIDVGISKRNSVELLEHWLEVEIDDRRGVTTDGVPVPMLPYFVDDFSTIIREALATGTADRKLAKRLVRLKLVLDSNDPTLLNALRAADVVAKAALPKAVAALGAGLNSSPARMASWALARLVFSLPDLDLMPSFRDALDTTISARAAGLLDPATVAPVWQQVAAGIGQADQNACQAILVLQNLAGTVSRWIVQDGVMVAQAIGGPGQARTPLWNPVGQAVASIMALNGHGGTYYLTGGLAGQLQTSHSGLRANDFLVLCPDGPIEILYRAGQGDPAFNAGMLNQRLAGVLVAIGLAASVVETETGTAVAIRRGQAFGGAAIPDATPTLVIIRAEPDGPNVARTLDHLEGWPVASTRDLVRLFQARAAHSPDFDLRQARKNTASFLLDEVLGRQLG
ncbi:MAG: hypothetical protein MUE52_05660 [Tabrizicola sp.]|jgi:hypothetical protein|nr:hypothetical protein [Tabrizicola sp.]